MNQKPNPGISRLEMLLSAAEIMRAAAPEFHPENVERAKQMIYAKAAEEGEQPQDVASLLVIHLADSVNGTLADMEEANYVN